MFDVFRVLIVFTLYTTSPASDEDDEIFTCHMEEPKAPYGTWLPLAVSPCMVCTCSLLSLEFYQTV